MQSEAGRRGWAGILTVANGRSAVPRCQEDGDSLGGGLLPKLVEELVAGRADVEFAGAVTLAQNGRHVVVDDVLGRKIHSQAGLGGSTDDKVDGCALGDCPRPLDVQICFRFFPDQNARGWTVVDDVQIGGGKAEEISEVGHVLGIDVSLADDGDSLPGSIDRGRSRPQWKNVVDGGEVVGSHREAVGALHAASARRGERKQRLLRSRLPCVLGPRDHARAVQQSSAGEVVERIHAGDHCR